VRALLWGREWEVYIKELPKSWWSLDLCDRKPVELVLKLVEPVSARGFFGSVTGSAGGWTRVKSIEPVLKLAELVFKKLHTTFWLIEQTGRAKKCNSSKTG
jgi:hypothetical protein